MKWISLCSAVIVTLGLSGTADAGLLNLIGNAGGGKSCGCAPTHQPACCKPQIVKPCERSVHTYQRQCSTLKPPACVKKACAPAKCAPAPKCAAPAPQACVTPCPKPAQPVCAVPAPCPTKPACAVPAPKAVCDPKAVCEQPCARRPLFPNISLPKLPRPHLRGLFQRCGADACGAGACGKQVCCDADPCEIAELIYKSQTACYAKHRRAAIHKLGDKFSCVCNPEIMCAFIYALNDADERVRAKAADEIGDQLRKNPCCCSPEIIAALTHALADCDRHVRRQAKQALQACGYEVVDGGCQVACGPCGKGACGPAGEAVPAPAGEPAPAPAPPTDGQTRTRSRLHGLFGMAN